MTSYRIEDIPGGHYMHSLDIPEWQMSLVDELRSKVADDLKDVPSHSDTFSLLRWLLGWDNKIDVIVPKLKSTLAIIKALKLHEKDLSSIESITSLVDSMSSASDYYPEGNVVVVEPLGRVDPKTLVKSGRVSELYLGQITSTEGVFSLIRAQERKLNRKLGIIIIMDMDGFSLDILYMPTLKMYMNMLSLLQTMFPDFARRIYIVNAPAAIHIGYNIVQAVISKQTRDKIEFLGRDWKRRLFDEIGTENILEHWGGQKKSDTPTGWIRMGGKVPPELHYNPDTNPNEVDAERLKTITVAARRLEKIRLLVEIPNSEICWFFRVKSGDIDFSITHESTLIWPKFRLSTEFVPEWGQVKCSRAGVYMIEFDNSHAKMWSKEVHYHLAVNQPK